MRLNQIDAPESSQPNLADMLSEFKEEKLEELLANNSLIVFFRYLASHHDENNFFIQRWADLVLRGLEEVILETKFDSDFFENKFATTYKKHYRNSVKKVDQLPEDEASFHVFLCKVAQSCMSNQRAFIVACFLIDRYIVLSQAAAAPVNYAAAEAIFRKVYGRRFGRNAQDNSPEIAEQRQRFNPVVRRKKKPKKEAPPAQTILDMGNLTLDDNRVVTYRDQSNHNGPAKVRLSHPEFILLTALAQQPSQYVRSPKIMETLKNCLPKSKLAPENQGSYLSSTWRSLAKKLISLGIPEQIITCVRHAGISLNAEMLEKSTVIQRIGELIIFSNWTIKYKDKSTKLSKNEFSLLSMLVTQEQVTKAEAKKDIFPFAEISRDYKLVNTLVSGLLIKLEEIGLASNSLIKNLSHPNLLLFNTAHLEMASQAVSSDDIIEDENDNG